MKNKAATRVKAARDPLAWLDSLPGGDDVLLLKREELAQNGDLRSIVAERAALVQSNMAATAPEVIVVE